MSALSPHLVADRVQSGGGIHDDLRNLAESHWAGSVEGLGGLEYFVGKARAECPWEEP